MDFPKTVRLNEGTMLLCCVPNQRSRGSHADTNEILCRTTGRVFGIPETSAGGVRFGNLVPPYAGTHGIVAVQGIPEPKPTC